MRYLDHAVKTNGDIVAIDGRLGTRDLRDEFFENSASCSACDARLDCPVADPYRQPGDYNCREFKRAWLSKRPSAAFKRLKGVKAR